ncbi:hypothetical protein DFJ74DRAFT_768778 [Hyaloraphidium curvatum]|nr:hypothetical protein DFJ74DRAFT_768778 [Hyaloraphidium curvatum]
MDLPCPVCGAPLPSLAALNAHLDQEHFAPPSSGSVVASWLKRAKENVQGSLRDLKMPVSSATMPPAPPAQPTALPPAVNGRTTSRTSSTVNPPQISPQSSSSSLPPPVARSSTLPALPTAPSPSSSALPATSPRPPPPPARPRSPVSHTDVFLALRASHPKRTRADRDALEANKLEGRYARLVRIHEEGRRVKEREREVAPWQEDKKAIRCAVCGALFTLTNRKHHCRLSGECICALPTCSVELPLVRDWIRDDLERDSIGTTRSCTRCLSLLSTLRPSSRPASSDELARLYAEMLAARKEGEALLADFNTVMVRLSSKPIDEADPDYLRAQALRKGTTAAFSRFDGLSKRIAGLPAPTPAHRRLHAAIRAAAASFLQSNLFTLRLLPSPSAPEAAPPPTQSPATLAKLDRLNSEFLALQMQKEQLEAQINAAGGREERGALLEAWGEVERELARVGREVGGLVK